MSLENFLTWLAEYAKVVQDKSFARLFKGGSVEGTNCVPGGQHILSERQVAAHTISQKVYDFRANSVGRSNLAIGKFL